MPTSIVFETHAPTQDNERGIATGWLPGQLSARGEQLALELGRRRRADGLAAVFSSDPPPGRSRRCSSPSPTNAFRCSLTGVCASATTACDNGTSFDVVHDEAARRRRLRRPYPGGESWQQAVERVSAVLEDLDRWAGRRVLLIGHTATRWALEHHLNGRPLETLVAEGALPWQAGWEYTLDVGKRR